MAVTRLERKARRNKSRAKIRVANIKRHQTRVFVESPNKGESGIILDTEDPFATLNETAAPAKKAKAPKAEEAPIVEETPAVEEAPVAEAEVEVAAEVEVKEEPEAETGDEIKAEAKA